MAVPILYPVSHLENGVVTTTGQATGFPRERLYDRDIGMPWKDSGTGTRVAQVSPGVAATFQVGTWILAAGHNLSGIVCNLDSSPDGGAWTTRDTVTPGSAALVYRTLSPLTIAYWRLSMVGTVVAPQLAELVLSDAGVTIGTAGPVRGNLEAGREANVLESESRGGYVWATSRGPARWVATYAVADLTDAVRAALETAHDTLKGGAKPAYLKDADGTLRWVQWLDRSLRFTPGALTAAGATLWETTLHFREVLGAAA